MIKVVLEKNLYLYRVPPYYENGLGQNICVLIDGSEALIIDAGYPGECQPVIDDLAKNGICITKVLPSHFHPDHVEGIFLLDNPIVYGNNYALETLRQFYKVDSTGPMKPTEIIDDESKLIFGKFVLTFKHAPGHSNCSVLTFINDSYIHLGDLYMRDLIGNEVLPYVKWDNIEAHISSLKTIMKHSSMTSLLSHGLCPIGTNDLNTGISNRLVYLQALIDSNNKISAEEAVKNCTKPFKRMKWRDDV